MNTILWWLAQNAVVVACLLPVVWVLCRMLRHRPAEQHLLWLLLLIKLVTPPIFEMPWVLPAPSLLVSSTPTAANASLERPSDVVAEATDFQSSEMAAASASHESMIDEPIATTVDPGAPAIRQSPELSQPTDIHALAVGRRATRGLTEQPYFSADQWLPVVLFTIWLTGSLGACALGARRVFAVRRMLREGLPPTPALDALVQKQAARLHLHHIDVKVIACAGGPFVTCFGRPRLLWPKSMSTHDALARSTAIMAHELAHIRRRDHYVMWLELAAGLVCWWNPLFWMIRRGLHESREMACDAMALKGASEARRDYAEMLLAITAAEKPTFYAAPVFGAGKLFHGSFERRLEMVFNERASGSISVAGFVLTAAIALLVLPVWTVGQEPPTPVPTTDTPSASPAAETAPAIAAEPPAPPSPTAPTTPAFGVAPPQALPAEAAPPPRTGVLQEFSIEGGGTIRVEISEDGRLILQVTHGDNVTEHEIDHIYPTPQSRPGRIAKGWAQGRAARAPSATNAVPPSGLAGAGTPGAAPQPRGPQIADYPSRGYGLSRYESRPAAMNENLELLRVDCSLAEIEVKKKAVEVEELQQVRATTPAAVTEGKVRLAELELQEAELKLRKCRLLLEAAEQRQADPVPLAR